MVPGGGKTLAVQLQNTNQHKLRHTPIRENPGNLGRTSMGGGPGMCSYWWRNCVVCQQATGTSQDVCHACPSAQGGHPSGGDRKLPLLQPSRPPSVLVRRRSVDGQRLRTPQDLESEQRQVGTPPADLSTVLPLDRESELEADLWLAPIALTGGGVRGSNPTASAVAFCR